MFSAAPPAFYVAKSCLTGSMILHWLVVASMMVLLPFSVWDGILVCRADTVSLVSCLAC